MSPVNEGDTSPNVVLDLAEDALAQAAEAKTLSRKALDATEVANRSNSENREALEKALASVKELDRKVEASDHRITFAEYDPMRLKYDRSQRSFDRMMRSKPESGSKLAPLVEDVQEWNSRAALVKFMAEGELGRKLSWQECLEMEAGMLQGVRNNPSNEKPFSNFDRVVGELARQMGFQHVRALDTATANEGAEWNTSLMNTNLMRKMAVALRAAGMIGSVPMPSASWLWPYETAFPTAQRVTETTTMTSNPYATSGVTEAYGASVPTDRTTFTARKIRAVQFKSYEFDVDSLVAVEDWLLERLAYGLARAKETAMFNGDRTSTHQDADITGIGASGTAPETVISGLRKFYLGQSTPPVVPVGATPTTIDLLNLIALLSKEYMADLANQAWFGTPLGTVHLMANKDCRTLNELGPQAVIVNGQIGEILGRPIVVSGLMRDDIDAAGVNSSAGPNDKTAILLAHLSNWKWGTRPSHPLEAERLPLTDQTMIVVHDRFDLQFVGAATDKVVGAIHGIPATITANP